jgi:iron complex outermembrane receptor protein
VKFFIAITITVAACALPLTAQAQSVTERVVVYGILPDAGNGLSADKVPGTLQSLSAQEITAAGGPTVLDSLGTAVVGISLSDSQGNSMFQDLRYHGFEASPLQGTSQGLAVYQNGMRLNEAFGDTVNWDAIPETAIARMDVWSNNPVFGLNALGGAIDVVMKNGFTWQGAQGSMQGGSYGHGMATAQYGMQDGNFALYTAAEGVTDSGWRLHSGSDLARLYVDAGWRVGDSEVHLVGSGAISRLGVVGPTPVELAAQNSAAVYTWPQATQDRIGSVALDGKTRLGDDWRLEATAYVRALRQRHMDGNDADFESCSARSSYPGQICLEDDDFPAPAGGKTTAYRNQFTIVNAAGQTIPYDDTVVYGTDDRTFTNTSSQGVTLQATSNAPVLNFANVLTFGGSIDHSAIAYRSTSTLGRMYPDLDVAVDPSVPGAGNVIRTLGDLGYAPADLAGTTDYYGFYLVDSLDLTGALTLTAGLRINAADITTRDRSGAFAELTGSHGYGHANPLAGLTYKLADGITAFGGYSQANRAPTPLETDCASQTQPCLLEGSLVADPVLKQVVAETGEAGLRGTLQTGDNALDWSASLFRTDSSNDIVALASTIQGRGYYTNVPLTRRQGIDLDAHYHGDGWSTHVSYSYLDATYQFAGTLASPNNPSADADGNVTVRTGNHIPLNPAYQARAGGDVAVIPGLTLGGDFVFTGSQYYDGDAANQNRKLASYWLLNLRASYTLAPKWQIFGLVNNVFNRHDASYATYFEPGDTDGLFGRALTDPRSITLIQPISAELGVRMAL